jgi:hypothetical protein
MRRKRRAGVSVLVVLCGIAIAVGAFLTWINARGARPASGIRHTSITGLFHWTYQTTPSFLHSFAVVVVGAGALVFIGGLVASRFIGVLFSLVTIVAAGLWIYLDAHHYHTTDLPYSDLRLGGWLVIGGGLIGLIFSFLLRRAVRQQNAWSP